MPARNAGERTLLNIWGASAVPLAILLPALVPVAVAEEGGLDWVEALDGNRSVPCAPGRLPGRGKKMCVSGGESRRFILAWLSEEVRVRFPGDWEYPGVWLAGTDGWGRAVAAL